MDVTEHVCGGSLSKDVVGGPSGFVHLTEKRRLSQHVNSNR